MSYKKNKLNFDQSGEDYEIIGSTGSAHLPIDNYCIKHII